MPRGENRRPRTLPWAALLAVLGVAGAPAAAGAASIADRVLETTLPNGLKVLVLEESKAPVVTVQVWYRVGSRNEQVGLTGLSHMLEHMMFKGTPTVGPKQFSRVVQRNGGHDNAFTSMDYTVYFENFAADRVGLALELEADRMANLLLEEKEFEPERKVVLEERRLRTEDDPVGALVEEMSAAAFRAHPYRNPIIGWATDIQQYTVGDVVRHYKTYYVPNNAVLVVVGDIKGEAVLPLIREAFGRTPRGPDLPRVRAVEPPQQGERRVTLRREAELPFVYAGYHVPNLTHQDSYALDVAEAVLSGGKSARLYRALVYERQIALYAGASYSRVSADPNLFYLYASVLPGHTPEEVEQALYAEVQRLATEPVSDRELQKAKNQVEADFLLGQDSVFEMARVLGQHEAVANWRLWAEYLPGIRPVTPGDVQRVVKEYLVPENRTVGILIPTQKAQQPAGAGPQQTR